MEQKVKQTKEQIQEEYDKYTQHAFKYPKAQFCYYYFKGICQLDTCQFAHGVDDFNFSNFLSLLKDKDAFQLEKQSEWQKPYFYRLIPQEKRTFDSLVHYQNTHLSSFSHLYTQQELILDPLKRMDIRREILKDIFVAFSIKLLEHFKQMDKDKFFQYFIDAGYCYSLQPYSKLCLYYSKKIKDKTTKRAKELVQLLPSNEEMMKTFVKALEDYSSTCKKPEKMFPMTFASINAIISKHIAQMAPNPFHFIEKNTISQKLFCEELIKHIVKSDKLSQFILNKKELNDFYEVINLNEIIDEIKGTFWAKHYSSHNTQFGFVSFDFIEKTFDIASNKEFAPDLIRSKLLYELFKAKNVVSLDNTSDVYVLNYARFLSNDLNDFVESHYHRRCGMIDKAIAEESLALFLSADEEGNYSGKELKLIINESLIKRKGDIVLVADENSLHYLIKQLNSSTMLSIDLEGDLSAGRVNLMQICNEENEIFVIDVLTFMTSQQKEIEASIPLLKAFLMFIFESFKIKKLFFDGRNDVNALHKQFNICPNNYIDLSSLRSFIACFKAQIDFNARTDLIDTVKEKEFDALVKSFHYCSRKGLNTVLSEYNPNQKTNELKETMHKLMNEKPDDYFFERPLKDEFLIYSALDVKYLKAAFLNMRSIVITQLKAFYACGTIDESKVDLLIFLQSVGHLNYGCKKANALLV